MQVLSAKVCKWYFFFQEALAEVGAAGGTVVAGVTAVGREASEAQEETAWGQLLSARQATPYT